MSEKIIAATYPGQDEEIRVTHGRLCWVMVEGVDEAFPRSRDITWRDATPEQTHTPKEFLLAFPPRPGGIVEAEARVRGLLYPTPSSSAPPTPAMSRVFFRRQFIFFHPSSCG